MKTKPGLISPQDWEFMEVNPYGDAGFNPEHNKRVIKDTIKKQDAKYRKQKRDFSEKTRERTQAAGMFLQNLTQGEGLNAQEYFGRRELARLRGEEVLERLSANPVLIEKLKKRLGGGQPL